MDDLLFRISINMAGVEYRIKDRSQRAAWRHMRKYIMAMCKAEANIRQLVYEENVAYIKQFWWRRPRPVKTLGIGNLYRA